MCQEHPQKGVSMLETFFLRKQIFLVESPVSSWANLVSNFDALACSFINWSGAGWMSSLVTERPESGQTKSNLPGYVRPLYTDWITANALISLVCKREALSVPGWSKSEDHLDRRCEWATSAAHALAPFKSQFLFIWVQPPHTAAGRPLSTLAETLVESALCPTWSAAYKC